MADLSFAAPHSSDVLPMTFGSLVEDLFNMDLKRSSTVLVHSSYNAIAPVVGGPSTVLDALMYYFSPGLLILPTHTWASNNINGSMVYDPVNSPCCVGTIPEMFRKRAGVYRSLHPTHSVAAYGKNAPLYVSGEELVGSPCPRHGCWGKLLDYDASILMIGCDLTKCTFIHGVEEWNGIPGRVGEAVPYRIAMPDGSELFAPTRRHIGSPSEEYYLAEPELRRRNKMRFGMFGHARTRILTARGVNEVVSDLLRDDPRMFDRLWDD